MKIVPNQYFMQLAFATEFQRRVLTKLNDMREMDGANITLVHDCIEVPNEEVAAKVKQVYLEVEEEMKNWRP